MSKTIAAIATAMLILCCTAFAADKNSLEKEYGIVIKFEQGISQDEYLTAIGDALSMIPKSVHDVIAAHQLRKGIPLTFDVKKNIDINVNVPTFAKLAAMTDTASMTISLYAADASVIAHEYGHILHTALWYGYSYDKIREQWQEINGDFEYDVFYYFDVYDNKKGSRGLPNNWQSAFANKYATTDYIEDFACTFEYAVVNKTKEAEFNRLSAKIIYIELLVKSQTQASGSLFSRGTFFDLLKFLLKNA